MIDLYCARTPNVMKIQIMLEEVGLPHRLLPVDVWSGEQFRDSFVALNPNSKVPVIVDHAVDGPPYAVIESGAILIYLAEKTGRLLPAHGRFRHDVLQWTVFQVANQGPMSGQFVHFQRYAGPGNDYSLLRYRTELSRLYAVLERRLSVSPFLGGDQYSIADVASLPWVVILERLFGGTVPFTEIGHVSHPRLSEWAARCLDRPAVQQALDAYGRLDSGFAAATDEDKDRIFGRGVFSHGVAAT